MLLAFNIGNSDIAFCVWNGETMLFSAELSTNTARTADEYAVLLRQTFLLRGFDAASITDVIIASVVPLLDDTLRAAVAHFTDARPAFVGAGMKTGLKIRIDTPAQLGADLVALACGAKRVTAGSAVIASFDTATTLTVLDTEGAVAGAVIMPGLLSAARALERDAALLTAFSLSAPRRVIGRNTADSMRSGLILGTAAQTDGMIARIGDELGCAQSEITLFASGKYAPYIIPHCRSEFRHAPHLLFEGLYTLYSRNR
ncbi:MAG: type III pantothenate kinase [Eubacteriales bacterium]